MNGPANSLRLLRIVAGVSVPQAASAVGMSETRIRGIERGKRTLTLTVTRNLTKVYADAIASQETKR